MNLYETYEHLMRFELERMVSAGDLDAVDFGRLSVEPARDPRHGDMSTNAALVAAGRVDAPTLAKTLARHFIALPDVLHADAAENGFVNLRLKPVVWHRAIAGILHGGGDRDVCGHVDHAAATDWSATDPVFNLSHVLALCCSVLGHAAKSGEDLHDNALAGAKLARIDGQPDAALMKTLAGWPYALANGQDRQIAKYLQDVATAFRAVWASRRDNSMLGFIAPADRELSRARLALVRATALVLSHEPG